MFKKDLRVQSNDSIGIWAYDQSHNKVFFDDLSDIGINEVKFINALKNAIALMLGYDDTSIISIDNGIVKKKRPWISSSGLEIILPNHEEFALSDIRFRQRYPTRHPLSFENIVYIEPGYCHWESSLGCQISSILPFDSFSLSSDCANNIEFRTWKVGNFANANDYMKLCTEKPEVKDAFADVIRLLTGESLTQSSSTTHKYYDDGGGHSTIYYT